MGQAFLARPRSAELDFWLVVRKLQIGLSDIIASITLLKHGQVVRLLLLLLLRVTLLINLLDSLLL